MSAAFKRKESAVTLAPLFLLTSQLFCGFIVNLNQIPKWIAKIQYLSFVKYAYQALVQVNSILLTYIYAF
jgi:ABC-type multidrug transport system permease subunit